jgi:class 3 adenylate cyclase/tetratricopeptide (TPR) repeat protein
MPACPRCGEEGNPDRARFCLACGAALAAAAAGREVRKTVTVVFVDVTGSTQLGEQLDPEALRHVMARYFERMREVIEGHGGTVAKFIGDAVMAVFGIPRLHEDDALRAVRAAAEMRAALAQLNPELEREHGVSLAVRMGVNTGEVVAGDPAAGQELVIGDPVNVAARLEQVAEPGEILIGAATQTLVRDAVRVEAVPALSLKGKADPIGAFRLQDVKPGVAGHVRRLDSPLVGRERELSFLRQVYGRALHERACHLFTVFGVAGVGKSRLVEEFLKPVVVEAGVLRGRCLPYGEGITFWPVIEVIKQAAGIDEADPVGAARGKLTVVLEREKDGALITERLAQLMGLGSAVAIPEETFWAVRKLLEATARKRPLVVTFDDIQWAEPTFLDLVEHIADWTREAPILLICVARPELLEIRPGWAGGKLNATSLLLERLYEGECLVLIDSLLGSTGLSREAAGRIMESADGNPLFVEELLAMLIDAGILQRRNGHWSLAADLMRIAVPSSIQALLSARLERLVPEERAVLERGAVEGEVFHQGGVVQLSPADAPASIPTYLMMLVRKDLIRPDRPEFAGEDAFRFRHLLIRDAAYQSIPKELRAELHERFAHWLEQAAGDRLAEYEEIVGYHLEEAHRYRTELRPPDDRGRELARQASRRLAAAGRRASARGDQTATIKLLQRAAALLPARQPELVTLLCDLGDAHIQRGELAQADVVLLQAIKAANDLGDRRLAAHGQLARLKGRFFGEPEGFTSEMVRAVQQAIPIFEEAADELGLARSWLCLAYVYNMRCQAGSAIDAAERALVHARLAEAPLEARNSLFMLLNIVTVDSELSAERLISRLDEIERQAGGEPVARAVLLADRAVLEAGAGRFGEARELLSTAKGICLDLGQKMRAVGFTGFNSFPVEMLAGDPAAAGRELQWGIEVLEASGEKAMLPSLEGRLAHALYAQGRYDEAEQMTQVAEGLAATDDIDAQTWWRGARAMVLARRQEGERAIALLREAFELAEGSDFYDLRTMLLLDRAVVLGQVGRPVEAARDLSELIGLHEHHGDIVSAGKARALREGLAAAPSGALSQLPES